VYALGPPGADERAEFWARYENAFGESYETVNPADPLDGMTIAPLSSSRWRRNLHDWSQARRRTREHDAALRRVAEELAAAETGKPIPLHRRVLRRYTRR
jgi:RNA polymerase-binding transcription factor DksA